MQPEKGNNAEEIEQAIPEDTDKANPDMMNTKLVLKMFHQLKEDFARQSLHERYQILEQSQDKMREELNMVVEELEEYKL